MKSESRILITGASGFAGGHLCRGLLAAGATVMGAGLPTAAMSEARDPFPDAPSGRWSFRETDLVEPGAAADLLAAFRPTGIFHLAAQASAARSFPEPARTFETNVGGTLSLLEALRDLPPDGRPRLVCAGSADEYGLPETDAPLDEAARLRPVSPYGVSKAAQTLLCVQYHLSYGLDVVVARPFPHTGPGQSPAFVFPSFARQILEIRTGASPPILRVGNLEARRDYLHVDDVVSAYAALMDSGRPGEIYNICSGIGHTIAEGLDMLLSAAGTEIPIERDPDRYRPLDVPCLLGDNRKIRDATGWRPRRDLDSALAELLEWTKENLE